MPFQKGHKLSLTKEIRATRGVKTIKGLARDKVVKKIDRHKEKILDALIASAKGLKYQDSTNGDIVHTMKPNTAVGEYLLNQLIGKPKETVEHAGEVQLKVDL